MPHAHGHDHDHDHQHHHHDHEHDWDVEESEIVTLVDEDGNEHDFEVVEAIEVGDKAYRVLIPQEQTDQEDGEGEEAYIFRVETDEDGDEILVTIEDEAEFNRVVTALQELEGDIEDGDDLDDEDFEEGDEDGDDWDEEDGEDEDDDIDWDEDEEEYDEDEDEDDWDEEEEDWDEEEEEEE